MFLKFTLINPQTGKRSTDETYVDADMIFCWQSMLTKYDKPITLINLNSNSAMGLAFQVDEPFDSVSAKILDARGQVLSAEEHALRKSHSAVS